MTRKEWLWLAVGAVALYLVYSNRQPIAEGVTAMTSGWQSVNDGPTWVPVIHQTETALGIPPNLLARMAYQESRFRPEIIDGSTASPAGALGILQLMPAWFASVRGGRPFSTQDTVSQISEAGAELARLFAVFGDWGTAVAAYNDGEGNIKSYLAGTRALPKETADYVSEVLADVPIMSAWVA